MRPTSALAALALPIALLGCNTGQAPARSSIRSAQPQRSSSASAAPHGSPAPPVTGDVPTALFHDPATGVSFRYPIVWHVGPPPGNSLPAAITGDPNFTIRQIVFFSPEGNIYARTNLSQLNFIFAVGKATSPDACKALVSDNGELSSPALSVRTPQDVAFTEGRGSDGAAGHTTSFILDSTFHNGRCLVFDRDFAVVAPGVQEGSQVLTPAQNTALQRHLDAVFASVTLP